MENIPAIHCADAKKMLTGSNNTFTKKCLHEYYCDVTVPGEKFSPETIFRTLQELREYRSWLEKGLSISREIYDIIKRFAVTEEKDINLKDNKRLGKLLVQMDEIDEIISQKKGLSKLISITIQRIIFQITEGYEHHLTDEENRHRELKIAKKSLLLYEGLMGGVNFNIALFKRMLL